MIEIQLRRILSATDFSTNAKLALEYACGLADKFQAELHILHVLPVIVNQLVADPYAAYGLPADFEDRVRASAEKALSELPDPSWAGHPCVVRELRRGSPFVEIVQYARENHMDLIVLGTHGRSGLTHMLLGSVAERVVRTAGCPVLTIRPPD
jgi:nucleotide-binding universal stress UspA family protein